MDEQRLDLQVEGMTCAACATRIEKGLGKLPGVRSATVNLALETARVEYDDAGLSAQDIIGKVSQLGYSASVKADDGDRDGARSEAIRRYRRRFIVSALLSAPLLWTMAAHFSWLSGVWTPELLMNPWMQLALATPVQFIIGMPFYTGAWKALKNRAANMDVLVALGTSAAYFYSLYLTLQWLGTDAHHMPDMYYETSAVLITLIVLGKLLEALAKGRSSRAIKALAGLQPKTAAVERDGVETRIAAADILVGDTVLIRPGEQLPVDGVVLEGLSAVDESMLTGESIPAQKQQGDQVIGATMNKHGFMRIRATKVGKDTALAQIIRIVEEAQGSKAPIQRVADRISGIFVPIVVGIAAITFAIWLIIGSGNVGAALEKAIAVLVIACPCALGLATPVSIMAGSGRAAEHGILFRGGEHLEAAHTVDTIVLDKTGTITSGKPEMTDVISVRADEDTLLRLVGAAEKGSEHPLAEAIVAGIAARGVSAPAAASFEAVPGFGVKAEAEGRLVLVGTRKLMECSGVDWRAAEPDMERLETGGKTAMLVAVDGEYAGIVAAADTVKQHSAEAVRKLQQAGLEVLMLTGDNRRTAEAIARSVGISGALAEVLPEGKAAEIQRLQQAGRKVAMVGDGINDAPALATADVGIAIGTGADVAMEAADVTLMSGDLRGIPDMLRVSGKTMVNIRQNLFWALAYNCLGIPIAALGFLAPWLAGAAMALSSVSVVLNALRLQRLKL